MTAPSHVRPTPAGRTGSRDDDERDVSAFLGAVAARGSLLRFVVRHPRRTLLGLRGIHRLPVVPVALPPSAETGSVRQALPSTVVGRRLLGGLRSTLAIPADPQDYTTGSSSSKHTLRRKIRRAERAGVTWRRIDDPAERRMLAAIAVEHDRTHPIARYRNPEASIDDLHALALWLGAFDGERPVLLTAIPVVGEWAALRYFRQLTDDAVASDTRYLMMAVLVAELSALGVRHLLDDASPQWLGDGVRHFQRMVGFRLIRLRAR